MKKIQVNEEEIGWAGFLVDADAQATIPLLDRAIPAAAHDDPDIVQEAWQKNRTIVTSNRRDFLRYIQQFQNRENQKECRDLWGLIVVPNLHLLREKGLSSIRNGLNVIPKGQKLRWPGAAFLNLYVHLTDAQKLEIRRFERCSCCECGLPISEPWNKWYRALPLLGDSVSSRSLEKTARGRRGS
jgi:hypothetical protein